MVAKPRSRAVQYNRFRNIAHGVVSAGRAAHGAYRAYRSLRGRSKAYPPPITGESDWRAVYRKKRFPRGRKRRWVKFVRKVRHVISKTHASQFNVIVRTSTVSQTAGEQEPSDIFTVLGGSSSVGQFDDISYLMDRAFATRIPEQTAGLTTEKESMRIVISGWMAECCITNTGATLAYLDCYYWRTKANVKKEHIGFTQLWTESLTDIGTNIVPTASETPLSPKDYGVTPFQGTQLAKSVVIWKKTRIKIPPGGTTQMEMRSGKDYYRTWAFDEDYCLLRGVTEGVFFIQYGAPGVLSPITSGSQLVYTTNTNYTWKAVMDNRQKGMHDLP